MVTAGDQLRPVFEGDPVRGLDRLPVVKHMGDHEPPVFAIEHSPVDGVLDPHVRERLGAPIRHQNRSIATCAVIAGVRTSPVHIDGPLERHAAGGGDVVEDGLGLDLVEGDAAELGRVEGAHRGGCVEQGKVGGRPALAPQVAEGLHAVTLERVFEPCNRLARACGLGQPSLSAWATPAMAALILRRRAGCGAGWGRRPARPRGSTGRRTPFAARGVRRSGQDDTQPGVRRDEHPAPVAPLNDPPRPAGSQQRV